MRHIRRLGGRAALLVGCCCAASVGLSTEAKAQSGSAGALYGTKFVGNTFALFRRNINTGADTHVGDIATGNIGGSFMSAFDPVGRRFFTYVSDNSVSPAVTRLYIVNVDTAAVGSVVVSSTLATIEFDPGAAAAVPTLGPFSLLILAGMIFGLGFRLLMSRGSANPRRA
jgi:hypothetical protein